jgi:hypothetical protein
MRREKLYLILNRETLTAINVVIATNLNGEACVIDRQTVIFDHECNNYVCPLLHFVKKVDEYIRDGGGDVPLETIEGNIDDCLLAYSKILWK